MDAIDQWKQAQGRVVELVSSADSQTLDRYVPACPDWTARDLLAHMIGVGSDTIAGNEPDDHNAEWTQNQVDSRSDKGVDDLVSEWNGLADSITTWMRENDDRPLGDVIIHEQDLRGALGVSGAQDSEALISLRNDFAGQLGESIADLPALELMGEKWRWLSKPDVESGEVIVEAPDFDLTRALLSRRSERQLRSWTTKGDITPYLDKFASLGPLPDDDLSETF